MKKFQYFFKNKEASFGKPIKTQIKGGTHITFEIILKKNKNYIALRRQSIPGHEAPPNIKKHPKGLLFFCHNLIRYGESVEKCLKRIVREQTGVNVRNFKVIYIDSSLQEKDGQWAFMPHIIAELEKIPKPIKYGNKIEEVILFNKNNIPNDFAFWSKKDLKQFLEEFD
ncbi:MAG: NUDIX domain-containing protein [Nanoarchaeota archaeon]